ncbi:hypothetical protein T484DRAFT_1872689, partial [Baffinella frigidus]
DAIQDATDHVGLTALHAAVKVQGHVDVVNALVQNGAPVDAQTARGNTPLIFAAGGGQTARGNTPLIFAAGGGQ